MTSKKVYMRIFITGASGYIGNAVAKALRNAGHSITGLVRTEEKAKLLRGQEITPLIGDLNEPKTYLEGIRHAEVIIHCAIDNENKISLESQFFKTLFDEEKDSNRDPKGLIYTSGIWVIGNTNGQIADENNPCKPEKNALWRLSQEEKLLKTPSSYRIAILRPGCVFGESGSLTALWFESAKTGNIEFIGDGNNHWGMIHVEDLAKAYVLTVEKKLHNIILNVVDNSHYTVKEMALACAKASGIPNKIVSISEQEGKKRLGSLAEGLLLDQKISNDKACQLLDWQPSHPSFIEDINIYYQAWKALRG